MMNEADRFMRSPTGRELLRGIRDHLEGRIINKVRFRGHDGGVTTTLVLDNGETYGFNDEQLDLRVLREQFSRLFRELTCKNKED